MWGTADPPRFVGPARFRGDGAVSFAAHVRKRRRAFGQALEPRKAIYLDTKFWVGLREAELGRSAGDEVELLVRLRRAVREGQIFCPISESVLAEVHKQADPETRSATSRLIDELSLGACLLSLEELMTRELAMLAARRAGGRLEEGPFTKLALVIGFGQPAPFDGPPMQVRAMQKAAFETIWELTAEQALGGMADLPARNEPWRALASRLNAENATHADTVTSYPELYRKEARGGLDPFRHGLRSQTAALLRENGLRSLKVTDTPEAWGAFLDEVLMRDQLAEDLPTVHIHATLHALLRWDKSRRLKENDFYDFQHAACAIVHCEALFTERNLCDLAHRRPTVLAKQFNRSVVATFADALGVVGAVAG